MFSYTSNWRGDKGQPMNYTCETKPEEYRGYQLFTRIKGKPGNQVIDVVKDGVCVTQMAGLNGARQAVDQMVSA